MPELKRLREGEVPIYPSKYLLIDRFCEPAVGYRYRLFGYGCDLQREYTQLSLEEAQKRALELAQTWDIPVIYLSCACNGSPPQAGRA